MVIPIFISVRGIFLVSLIPLGLALLGVVNNSKEKSEYDKVTGTVEYFDKTFGKLPVRNKGEYRYLKVDQYPFLFEIYEPNSEPTEKKIDDLKVGDIVDIYFYETDNTVQEGLNRFTQFIDKEAQPYFIRNGFQRQLGYVMIGLVLLMNIGAIVLWKVKKLRW